MRGTAAVNFNPVAGDAIDIDAAGTMLGPSAFVDVWNCFAKDDGTLTRRSGLSTYHDAFDASGSALNGLGLSEMPVQGLWQFDRVTDARGTSSLFLAKVGDYLIGSRYGLRFDQKIAQHLGATSVPDLVEVYDVREHRRYVVICTNDRGWQPSYWSGRLTPSVSSYDVPPWGYFTALEGVGYQEFGVFHNRRLFLAGGDPFQVIYSAVDDFRDFANGGAFLANPEFGKVTGFFRTYYGELLLGQERAISRIYGDPPVGANVVVTQIGLANNRGSVHIGNDQLFVGTDGHIYSLGTTQQFGDLLFSRMSGKLYRQFGEGPLESKPAVWAQNDRENQIAWFGVSRYSARKVDACWGYDYARQRFYRLANKAIYGPACAAAWRLPRFNGREKVVFGSYETDDFEGQQKGRIWHFLSRHKEDHYLTGRTEAVDAATPLHLDPHLRWADLDQGGGAAGWPHQSQVSVSGTYAGSASAHTTIVIRVSSIAAGTGVIGTGTITATWDDRKGTHSGSISLGSAYTPGNSIALTGTGISVTFAAPQSVAVEVGQEVWILVDRGYRVTENYRSGVFDAIDLRSQFKSFDESASFRNFVSRASTPMIYAGSPETWINLEGITFITRVTGNRADDQNISESNVTQNPWRWSLDVLLKCDEDPKWTQFALLDGNTAKQYHLDPSQAELAGKYPGRPNRQIVLGATQAASGVLVDPIAVNIERVKIGRRCKTFRVMVGQFTMSAKGWFPTTDPYKGYQGDFGLVGMIFHYKPLPLDGQNTMAEGTTSKTWVVGS